MANFANRYFDAFIRRDADVRSAEYAMSMGD